MLKVLDSIRDDHKIKEAIDKSFGYFACTLNEKRDWEIHYVGIGDNEIIALCEQIKFAVILKEDEAVK